MSTKYLIGTIHSGKTSHKELGDILDKINPDQVLIELPENFSEKGIKKRKVVPDEMLFAYNWVNENDIRCGCFDVSNDTGENFFADDYSEESKEYQELLDYQDSIIVKHDWKDFNKRENIDLLDHPLEDTLFNSSALKERKRGMLEDIREKVISEGKVVIITGTAHLDFLLKNLENTQLALDN